MNIQLIKRFGVGIVAIALLLLGAAWYMGQPKDNGDPNQVLMTVEYSGGLCESGKVCFTQHNLYQSGAFDQHTPLSTAEVAQLKETINKTDFLKYQPNPHANCPSFADGADQVLIFPQKYPGKSFKLCTLQIAANDPALNFITDLVQKHTPN